MEYKQIGSTDLRVSELGFGCAPIASRAGGRESARAINRAFELGINYFDTADMYGVGGSEETLARVFAGRRDKIIISTKCGYEFSSRLKALAWVKPLVRPLVTRLKGVKASAGKFVASQKSQRFDPQYIQQCAHDSLRRLNTDHIDLYLLHDPPIELASRDDVFQTLSALKQAGKIRWHGVSCDLNVAKTVMPRAGDYGISAMQVNLNLLEQEAIDQLLPLARQASIGIIARQPFAHGRLMSDPTVPVLLNQHGLPSNATYVAQLALRFALHQKEVSSVLAGMMKPQHLETNLKAVGMPPLTDKERTFVAALRSKGEAPHAD